MSPVRIACELYEVGEAVAGFDDLAGDAFGFFGEGVAAVCGFFVGGEFDAVEAVLGETLDAELDGA